MTTYILAQISIHDRERYERYRAAFMPVLIKYKGRLLVADEDPEVLHGEWRGDKVILMGFADAESALRWMNSPEYKAISVDRLAATEGVALLLHGLAGG
jgi:uncharacterized protein (DUF1330 family)